MLGQFFRTLFTVHTHNKTSQYTHIQKEYFNFFSKSVHYIHRSSIFALMCSFRLNFIVLHHFQWKFKVNKMWRETAFANGKKCFFNEKWHLNIYSYNFFFVCLCLCVWCVLQITFLCILYNFVAFRRFRWTNNSISNHFEPIEWTIKWNMSAKKKNCTQSKREFNVFLCWNDPLTVQFLAIQ